MIPETSDPRSIPQLISDLTRDVTTLVRQETALFRAELSEKLGQLGKGVGEVAAGAVCLLAALIVLLQALVVALSEWMGPGWASLLVGVLVAIVGAVLVKTGTSNMSDLTPRRTVRQVEKDGQMAKDHMK